jgi:hypothetical protein
VDFEEMAHEYGSLLRKRIQDEEKQDDVVSEVNDTPVAENQEEEGPVLDEVP